MNIDKNHNTVAFQRTQDLLFCKRTVCTRCDEHYGETSRVRGFGLVDKFKNCHSRPIISIE